MISQVEITKNDEIIDSFPVEANSVENAVNFVINMPEFKNTNVEVTGYEITMSRVMNSNDIVKAI